MRKSCLIESIKLLAAGLIVFISMLLPIAFFGNAIEENAISPILIGLAMAAYAGIICLSVYVLFNWSRRPFRSQQSPEEFIRELEEKGLLLSEEYVATRAFGVEEFEDEGSHYFLELEDGRVLFITGQELYEYDPIVEGETVEAPRRFPCTEFTLRRHRKENYIVDILCRGAVLEPEVVAPHFGKLMWEEVAGGTRILEGACYDEIKKRCLAPK